MAFAVLELGHKYSNGTDQVATHSRIRVTFEYNLLLNGLFSFDPAEPLASPHMAKLVDKLARQSDVVIVDTPPALTVTDASIVGSQMDGALLVVDTNATRLCGDLVKYS